MSPEPLKGIFPGLLWEQIKHGPNKPANLPQNIIIDNLIENWGKLKKGFSIIVLPQSRLDGFVSTLVSVPARLVELHGAGQPVVAGLQVDGQERPTFFQKVGDFFARKFSVTARLWKIDQVCYNWLWWQSNVEVNASVLASDSFSHFEGVKWVLVRAVVAAQG